MGDQYSRCQKNELETAIIILVLQAKLFLIGRFLVELILIIYIFDSVEKSFKSTCIDQESKI